MEKQNFKHKAQTNTPPRTHTSHLYAIGCSEEMLKRQKNNHANSYCPEIGQGHITKIEVSIITDAIKQITAGQCTERQTRALLKRKMYPF